MRIRSGRYLLRFYCTFFFFFFLTRLRGFLPQWESLHLGTDFFQSDDLEILNSSIVDCISYSADIYLTSKYDLLKDRVKKIPIKKTVNTHSPFAAHVISTSDILSIYLTLDTPFSPNHLIL